MYTPPTIRCIYNQIQVHRTTPDDDNDDSPHLTRTQYEPIFHDRLDFAGTGVSASCCTLESLVEAFKAKTPVAATWPIIPHVRAEMTHEVVLRTLQAYVLGDGIKCVAVLDDCVIHAFQICQ